MKIACADPNKLCYFSFRRYVIKKLETMDNTGNFGYDIIGDVHGHIDELEILLERLDYQYIESVWQHPTRKAIFTGDFICRGLNSKPVIALIRDMVNHNFAQAILGNHELNAILYFTKSKEKSRASPN